MVDCGASKCLQERKNFKKELLSWTKKVPLLVGLEEISKVVLGRRFARKILEVTQYGEKKQMVEDWEPQENCTFCDSKSKFYVSPKCQNTSSTENSYLKKETVAPGVSSPYTAHITNGHKYNNDIHPSSVSDLPDSKTTSSYSTMTSDPDQPLDLTMPTKSYNNSHAISPPTYKPITPLKVPCLEGKFPSKKRESGNGQKKVYTEEELAAAVSDIRSGKIGTRRAAALYGIPRSTLRNKMCRLDMMEANNTSSTPVTALQAPKLTVRDLLQNGNGVTYKDEGSVDLRTTVNEEDDNKWSSIKNKHDLNAGVKRPFGMPPLFYNSQYMAECERAFQLANPYAYDMKLPYLQDLIWRYAQERMESNSNYSSKEKDIQDYINNSRNDCSDLSNAEMTALDLQIPTLPSSSEHYVTSLNSSPSRASETQDAESPPSAQETYITSQINDTLKDVISKTISDKMLKNRLHLNTLPPSDPQSRSSTDPMVSPPSQPVFPNPYEGFYLPPTNGFGYSNGRNAHPRSRDEPPVKKHKFDMKHVIVTPERNVTPQRKVTETPTIAPKPADMNTTTNEDDKPPVKKTRPKRGQYRKYNHELLMEAVRAVQRGEMSVHRAGSYYGVPHSTLEYKVKERHLLRQKKPREPRKKNANGSNTNNSTTEASNSNKTVPTTVTALVSQTPSDTAPSTPVSNNTNDSNQSKEADKDENTTGANVDENKVEPLSGEQLKAAQSLQASLLMSSLGASGGLPNFPLAPNFPMGFGWPPLINGNLPFPLPDAALAASLYSASGLGINTSASELLKKLQQKVQLETSADECSGKEDNADDKKNDEEGQKEEESEYKMEFGDENNENDDIPTEDDVKKSGEIDQVDIESGDSHKKVEVVDK